MSRYGAQFRFFFMSFCSAKRLVMARCSNQVWGRRWLGLPSALAAVVGDRVSEGNSVS